MQTNFIALMDATGNTGRKSRKFCSRRARKSASLVFVGACSSLIGCERRPDAWPLFSATLR